MFLKLCGLLTAVLLTSPVLPSYAATTDDHLSLLRTVRSLGITVSVDHPLCSKGVYGGYLTDGSALILCSVGDQAERLDTIRHESWHIVQDLKDCSLQDTGLLTAMLPKESIPKQYHQAVTKDYPSLVWHPEAEAFWAAHNLSAQQINYLLQRMGRQCGLLK